MASGTKKAKDKGIFIIHLTQAGKTLAQRLKGIFPEARMMKFRKSETLCGCWPQARAFLFIGAAGIAVRIVAPLLENKWEDPAVVVMDEKGRNVISLLSGHAGGANRLARQVADFLGGNPVITTATDVNSLTPVDVFAAGHAFVIEPGQREILPAISARHLEKKRLSVYSDLDVDLPPDYRRAGTPEEADVLITDRTLEADGMKNKKDFLYLRPKDIVLGIGFNSGVGAGEIEEAVEAVFEEAGFSVSSIGLIATHEKKAAEEGLREFARGRGLKVRGYQSARLNAVSSAARSEAAMKALGARAVAEPAAVLAGGGELIIGKRKHGRNITIAASRMKGAISGMKGAASKGVASGAGVQKSNTLVVVGTGPGGLEHLTPKAIDAIRESDYIVGYKSYLAHIAPLIKGKRLVSSSMTEEVMRVKEAVRLASGGNKVCLISGGDPGIYGMAGLAIEVAANMDPALEVSIIPGISALNACASALGAPLMHDFAVISLSDRLTPWEVIEERLEAAARADFVTVLYNPKSGGRQAQIERAREIMLAHRDSKTPVGIVTDATRQEEDAVITTLGGMLGHEINMKSTVIIGNSKSRRLDGRLGERMMLTPRGYERKYSY
ncbi:MAG: precorrin-3B C(17)-methyltransferase [Nitrospiraceae bacterium]|nr:precorrin-3B C(17)-methyltransferase [Nitrospiraceae bacterium]